MHLTPLSIAVRSVASEANEAFYRQLHSFVNPFAKFDSNS
ncbi:hypothetical protein AB71_5022 [Escherichia coli 1-182-04_S1_C3]|nr:hypothetical protein AB71_5022 [Escherichia coli 1-182-04_S1_C3]